MIKSKIITILLASQFKKMKTFMHKKFIRISCVLTTLLIMTVPAVGVQRFVIDADELNQNKTLTHLDWKLANPIPIRIDPGTLEWNGMRIEPVRSYQNNSLVEYILANNNENGPTIVRGQTVKLNMLLRYQANGYDLEDGGGRCCLDCCTVVCFPIVLPFRLCECGTNWEKTERQTQAESMGQILFQTDHQPHTIRMKVSGGDWTSLLLTPEERQVTKF